jgi:multiple antibiotic resistance protein
MATGLISIVNPIGAIPTFITLSGNHPNLNTKSAALKTTIACVMTLIIASIAGEVLLRFFGITLPSFQTGGGVLLLLVGISMLHAEPSTTKSHPQETQEAMGKDDFTVVPMGIPILSGPGAISTVILYMQQAPTLGSRVALVSVILFTGVIVYFCLRMGEPIRCRIGQTGVNIATRLMGLLLAALAVEFITKGLGQLFPGLLGIK